MYGALCSANARTCNQGALVRVKQNLSIGPFFTIQGLCACPWSYQALPFSCLICCSLLLDGCLALDCKSIFKASAPASGHGAVCYLLFWALAQLQHPYLARPPSALNVDPPCAQRPFKIALWDRGAESDRAPPLTLTPPDPRSVPPSPKRASVRSTSAKTCSIKRPPLRHEEMLTCRS